MGAEYRSDFIDDPKHEKTDKLLQEIFRAMIDEDAYNYGHAGYTGSFAEKESATIHRGQMFEDREAAEKYVCDDLDSDKWGPADIVPVKDKGWYVGGWCSS